MDRIKKGSEEGKDKENIGQKERGKEEKKQARRGKEYNYTYQCNKHALDKENMPSRLLNTTRNVKMHRFLRSSKMRRQDIYKYI